ncbi:hypothetical protein BEE12_16100 [Pantoea agglomerans]|nr:hypothetical protein BEE12_16100 [Pantoea agglomerans]
MDGNEFEQIAIEARARMTESWEAVQLFDAVDRLNEKQMRVLDQRLRLFSQFTRAAKEATEAASAVASKQTGKQDTHAAEVAALVARHIQDAEKRKLNG